MAATISKKLSNSFEGALAGGGDPATSPLIRFRSFSQTHRYCRSRAGYVWRNCLAGGFYGHNGFGDVSSGDDLGYGRKRRKRFGGRRIRRLGGEDQCRNYRDRIYSDVFGFDGGTCYFCRRPGFEFGIPLNESIFGLSRLQNHFCCRSEHFYGMACQSRSEGFGAGVWSGNCSGSGSFVGDDLCDDL